MARLELGIVDDDESILYTVEAMVSSMGMNIRTTTDPEEALKWVGERQIDMLLLDYHMPSMSGLEVVRKARAISRTVVLLVLTIEESQETAHELLMAGADDFITKPLRLADFSSRVALHAELLRYRQAENPEERQKGFSEEKTRLLYSLFADGERLSVSETSERSGLAYPTAHRYLEMLVKKGRLIRRTTASEGHHGRPKTLYSRSGDSQKE